MKGRGLTHNQMKVLLDCIQQSSSPTPLFIKMLIDFAYTWRSFTPPSDSTDQLKKYDYYYHYYNITQLNIIY